MKLELEIYGALCATSTFVINGVIADSDDFGSQGDADPENAEDYSCGDMRFDGQNATDEILAKYKITADEYKAIVEQLEEKLSFGGCGWCS